MQEVYNFERSHAFSSFILFFLSKFFYNICNLIILSVMFSTILEEADEETASRMVPVILERVGLLYHVKNYRKEIHE